MQNYNDYQINNNFNLGVPLTAFGSACYRLALRARCYAPAYGCLTHASRSQAVSLKDSKHREAADKHKKESLKYNTKYQGNYTTFAQ